VVALDRARIDSVPFRARSGQSLTMHRATDYERMAEIYDSGRALPLEWLEVWRRELSAYLSLPCPTVLDVGSGTGLWAEALASWFGAAVVGIEPSNAMRRTAASKRLRSRVVFVGATAERIPLHDQSFDCAWLSTVVHHIADLERCATELRRVLIDGGLVLIRNNFGDRLEGVRWLEFFPSAREVASQRWPTIRSIAETFRTAGFEVEAVRSIPEIVASDLREYHKRLSVRANSTLTLISDREFEVGLDRLERAAEQHPSPSHVVDQRGLLVLRRWNEGHARRRGA
jgi:ubiquinone/menaquinone biosynthesis C-methylase UbiE